MLRKSHNLKPILLRFWLTFWPHGLKPNLIWEYWALVSNSLTHYWDSTPWPPPPGKAEHLLEEPKSSVMVTVSPSLCTTPRWISFFVTTQFTAETVSFWSRRVQPENVQHIHFKKNIFTSSNLFQMRLSSVKGRHIKWEIRSLEWNYILESCKRCWRRSGGGSGSIGSCLEEFPHRARSICTKLSLLISPIHLEQ